MAGVPRPQLPPDVTWCRIMRPALGGKLKVIALTDLYAGMWTHWNGRTTYCPGPKACRCAEGKDQNCVRRWRGYLPALHWESGTRIALELTPSMATAIDLWATQGAELRGSILVATRSGRHGHGPILLERAGEVPDRDRLPEPWDPTWCVLAILGVPYARITEMHKREESHIVLRLSPQDRLPG